MMSAGLITISALFIGTLYLIQKYWRFVYYSFYFKGAPAWPILGNGLLFLNKTSHEILIVLQELVEKYGAYQRIWIGPSLHLLVAEPELIETILSSQKHIDKGEEYTMLTEWLGDGLLLSTGRKWLSRRKAITPAFHFKILDQFIEVFDRQGSTLVHVLEKHAKTGETFDIFPLITLYALDVICETSMGTASDNQTNPNSEYVRAVKEISNIVNLRAFHGLYRYEFFFRLTRTYQRQKSDLKILHSYTDSVIRSRRDELQMKMVEKEENKMEDDVGIKKKMALLDILLQSSIDGKPLTDLDIREEVDTFMFEGHDTTTSGISFALYLIAKHEKVQKKLADEIERVFGDDKTRSTTMKDLNDMSYLDLVVKEALRMYPSVPFIGRSLKEDLMLGGKLVPAGTITVISPLVVHMNPKCFKNPKEFIPERFEEEVSGDKVNPYRYIPFSAGPRNCIGQKFAMLEMKSVLSKILRHYELQLPEKSEDPLTVAELVLRPLEGIHLKIKPRS